MKVNLSIEKLNHNGRDVYLLIINNEGFEILEQQYNSIKDFVIRNHKVRDSKGRFIKRS